MNAPMRMPLDVADLGVVLQFLKGPSRPFAAGEDGAGIWGECFFVWRGDRHDRLTGNVQFAIKKLYSPSWSRCFTLVLIINRHPL